jgi:hypothetical protein
LLRIGFLLPLSLHRQRETNQTNKPNKMKTKENKSIQSAIQLPSGLYFTSKRDFTKTLFHPLDGKTAFGYYTFHQSKKHGTQSIRFRRSNGELFALILSNGWNATARTAWEENGKVFNLYALTDEGRKLIGTEETQMLIEIVNNASAINSAK